VAVEDPKGILHLELLSLADKYNEFCKTFHIAGKPELTELKGSLPIRLFDSLMLKTFGLVLGWGKRLPNLEDDYERLSGNFNRIAKAARLLGHLGPLGFWVMKMNFRASAKVLVRQGVCGVKAQNDHIEAAREYFKIADLFGADIEICERDGDEIEFRLPACPAGYLSGDNLKLCSASMEFDSRCVSLLGGRLIIKEVIPAGAPACLLRIAPANPLLTA
jgi:hypothetical protein